MSPAFVYMSVNSTRASYKVGQGRSLEFLSAFFFYQNLESSQLMLSSNVALKSCHAGAF